MHIVYLYLASGTPLGDFHTPDPLCPLYIQIMPYATAAQDNLSREKWATYNCCQCSSVVWFS